MLNNSRMTAIYTGAVLRWGRGGNCPPKHRPCPPKYFWLHQQICTVKTYWAILLQLTGPTIAAGIHCSQTDTMTLAWAAWWASE